MSCESIDYKSSYLINADEYEEFKKKCNFINEDKNVDASNSGIKNETADIAENNEKIKQDSTKDETEYLNANQIRHQINNEKILKNKISTLQSALDGLFSKNKIITRPNVNKPLKTKKMRNSKLFNEKKNNSKLSNEKKNNEKISKKIAKKPKKEEKLNFNSTYVFD